MSLNFARPLNTVDLAHYFLTNALGIDEELAGNASMHVMATENLLAQKSFESTLQNDGIRHAKYKNEQVRALLRETIFKELVKFKRLLDDEKIILGKGGAKPQGALQLNKQAFLLTGLPASGKSAIANKISDIFGAYIIDSDYAKRKFPEFNYDFGASVVHEESSLVTFGDKTGKLYTKEKCLYEFCVAKGCNMVIPKIGNLSESVREMRDALIKKGYKVHLILISLNRQESCKRALNRFLETKRYVPLGLVFDVYGNDSMLTYYRVKEDKEWESIAKLSTATPKGDKPLAIQFSKDSPVVKMIEVGSVGVLI